MASTFSVQRQHHRRDDQIVRNYTDLTPADIKLLTKILSHAPKQRNSTIAASYERIVREQTLTLPTHLRTKIPWISTFCSVHNRINPFVVNSIREWLKDEVDHCVPRVWSPLEEQNLLNAEQSKMLALVEELSTLWTPLQGSSQERSHQRKASVTYAYGSAKCGGCVLAQIGGHEQVLIAIGAFFIGRVRSSIWERSKRIIWMESWLRDTVDESGVDQAIRKMWDLGMELRELRKKANISERPYVHDYVERAQAVEQAQRQKQPAQDDLTEVDQNADGWLSQVATADELFDNEAVWDELQPSKSSELEPNVDQDADSVEEFQEDLEASRLFRPPSSVYSQHSKRSQASSHNTESRLLDMYRHSAYTQDGRPF